MGFDNESILNIHTVVAEYFCPVCRTLVYPNEALQTPCTHLYCKPCLAHIASSTRACPYDGYLVTEAGSKPLVETNKALAEAIGKIAVRCLYHMSGCMWQGSLSEGIVHRSGCAFGNSPVICIKCQVQIAHRQVEEHTQICNLNQVMNPQPLQGPQNVCNAANLGALVSIDQSKTSIQAGIPTPQLQASQNTNLNQPAIANPQPQASSAIVMSTSQWYQPQYQQYYQQYPVCDAYQQVNAQMYPYWLQVTQPFHQPPLQVHGLAQSQAHHTQLQPVTQVLLQAQPELRPLTQVPGQSQHQSLLQAQPQILISGQRAALPDPNQNQAHVDQQQQIQPPVVPHVQIPTQNQLLTQAQPHVQGYAQQHMQVPQFQQSLPSMHHSQPSLGHPDPQSQLQHHPQGYPQFQPHPQPQHPNIQEVLQIPTGQVPAQFAQPIAHMRPLEPPQRLPSRDQAPGIPPAQQHVNPCGQPGLAGHQQPVIHQVQQPMTQQYVQLPQVSAGCTSGLLQGQLHHTGPAQEHSQACPRGPPQLMQHPQQGAILAHDTQPRSSQSHVRRPAILNHASLSHQLPQFFFTARDAPHTRPPEFGSTQPSGNQNGVNMINQLIRSEPSLSRAAVEGKGDLALTRTTKQQENKLESLKNSHMDANGPKANLNEIKPENGGGDSYRRDEAVTKDAFTELQKGQRVACRPVTTQRLKEEGNIRALDHPPGGKIVQNKAVDARDVPLYSVKQQEVNMNVQSHTHINPGQIANLGEHFHPAGPNQPGYFYPKYQLGGSQRGPNDFANHNRSSEPQHPGFQRQYSQSHPPPYGPPGFVSSSAPVPCCKQVRAPIGKHADAFPMEPARHLDQVFPHQQRVFGDSPDTKSTNLCLREPRFQSGYTYQGFPNAGSVYAGGSDSFDKLRKRKSMSMGWCRICEVDYGSMEGLEMHSRTYEHQRMAMDMVDNIKQKSARISKTSNAHSGHGEASK